MVQVFQFNQNSLNQHILDFIINQRYMMDFIFVGAGVHPGAGVPGVLSLQKSWIK